MTGKRQEQDRALPPGQQTNTLSPDLDSWGFIPETPAVLRERPGARVQDHGRLAGRLTTARFVCFSDKRDKPSHSIGLPHWLAPSLAIGVASHGRPD